MSKPRLFTVRLTDEERAALEAYRAKNGLRSESDAIRHLISSGDAGRLLAAREKQLRDAGAKAQTGDMPISDLTPAPPFKTRLKGEWKPK